MSARFKLRLATAPHDAPLYFDKGAQDFNEEGTDFDTRGDAQREADALLATRTLAPGALVVVPLPPKEG